MGGNALKLVGINPIRISTEKSFEIIREAQTTLSSLGLFSWIKPVKYWKKKPDHGDIDLVAHLNQDHKGNPPKEWAKSCAKALGSKAHYWNKPVVSLEFHQVQLDITGRENAIKAQTNLDFCHYSPFGNILGRMIRKTGAKWGVDGLEYNIHQDNKPNSPQITQINLSHNIDTILNFCGLDPNQWHKGFQTQEEIFKYAASSPLFDKKIFLFENLNHAHRKRDKTRPDYHSWLEFIVNTKDNTIWNINETEKEYEDRITQYQDIIDNLFPDAQLLNTQKLHRENHLKFKELKREKFNGQLVSLWIAQTQKKAIDNQIEAGIQGEELGITISAFKKAKKITEQDRFLQWLEITSKETCQEEFLEFYYKLKENNKDEMSLNM
jgi:hypothetical protein